MGYLYKHAVVGGTFDHLHRGHKYLLGKAFKVSENVTIGLTTSEMLQDKNSRLFIEDFDIRERNLKEFLEKKGYMQRAKINPIHDIYGNTLLDGDLEAIFVTSTVLSNANLINKIRVENGLTPLTIEIVALLRNSQGEVYSSTNARKEFKDTKYLRLFNKSTCLKMPESLREKLREPFGEVISNWNTTTLKNSNFVIAVGDIVVSSLIKNGITPNISIYDGKTKRQAITDKEILKYLPKPTNIFKNSPGTIDCAVAVKLSQLVRECSTSQQKFAVRIEGEEDLLSIPTILSSPLGGIVVYGLSGIGAVVVTVTPRMKKMVGSLLEEFTQLK